MSCCGSAARWNILKSQWECEKCKSAVSNDPNYLYAPGSGVIDLMTSIEVIQRQGRAWGVDQYGQKYEPYYTPEKKCVCGGEKAKTTHAHWCEVKN